jgi:23S rRNA (cytosine1962-C5)-methyltransferase
MFSSSAQTFMIPTEKIVAASEKRATIRAEQTNAVRLVDGSGDSLGGLIIDDFAGRWIIQTLDESEPTLDPTLGYRSLYWKPLLKRSNTVPKHLAGEPADEPFCVQESGLEFEIDFRAGYSPGLFLDQRTNRGKLRSLARGRLLLNTFSYTCAFGVAAAMGGAATVNLDLSRNYLNWGKRNYELNRIDLSNHEFLYGDVFDWLGRFKRRGRKFDLIILDPPTFSRDRRSRVFRVQDDFGGLADRAVSCLNRNGLLLCSTNFRGMTFSEFLRILRTGIDRTFETVAGSMPHDFTGDQYLKTVWLQF